VKQLVQFILAAWLALAAGILLSMALVLVMP
jgi:hypothetical protein